MEQKLAHAGPEDQFEVTIDAGGYAEIVGPGFYHPITVDELPALVEAVLRTLPPSELADAAATLALCQEETRTRASIASKGGCAPETS